jgi:hypothetical protein
LRWFSPLAARRKRLLRLRLRPLLRLRLLHRLTPLLLRLMLLLHRLTPLLHRLTPLLLRPRRRSSNQRLVR